MAGTGPGAAGFQNSSGFSGGDSNDIEGEKSLDPASSGFFSTDVKRHDDLKEMLDSTDDKKKLEAMKRIIGLVAKGKDASPLFPAVVKNVVCKNLEVKKLVYVYLTRYAEEQQDLALLSIATFQRSMKDPNQLIRASALRVLSSIRIPVIVPIMMLVIKDGVADMSPYVRKAAAHAIPKLYSVDPEQKDELVEFLEKLLADKTTLVIGSAIQAFEELCPERIDLIHKNYRKLCSLLADVEEWGQVIILNMLTRYARTQFISPHQEETIATDKDFYSSNEDSDSDASNSPAKAIYIMDADHRLLLKSSKPLLNSRNSATVMAVVQLYYHCAPKSEVGLVARAMIRLLRSHKEIQFIVLSNIATLALNRRGMFEPYIKSFYINANDAIHIKLLKLEILTSLATENNVSVMIREFQQYVLSPETSFSTAAIQAIGKIATGISDITDACMGGLISLLSNKSESVVGESVVVIKKLLQMKSSGHKDIIIHLAQMVDKIAIPKAKGSILWLIGEYSDKVPKIAPDVLRKAAKVFMQEEDIVKLQTLNLAAKLCITNPKQTQLLCQYVFNLAKYDQSYDIRDRARFLKALILPGDNAGALAKHAKKIFLADKPAPVVESKHKERDQYQLSSLSHTINNKAIGYNELPTWPTDPPPSDVRNVEVAKPSTSISTTKSGKGSEKEKAFYSDSEEETSEEDSSEESGSEETDEESGSEEDSEEGGEETSEEDEEESSEEEDSEEESSSEADSSEESSSEEEVPVVAKAAPKKVKPVPKKETENLLDLFDFAEPPASSTQGFNGVTSPISSTLQPLVAGMTLSPSGSTASTVQNLPASHVPSEQHELINRMSSGGLAVTYRFTRSSYLYSDKMVAVELSFTNKTEQTLKSIKIGDKRLQSGMHLHDFHTINELEVGASVCVTMGIDFNDTLQPADFDLVTSEKTYRVKVEAPVGELMSAVTMSENEFGSKQKKLGGMNETSATIDVSRDELAQLHSIISRAANMGQVPSSQDNVLLLTAKTLSNKCDVLLKAQAGENGKSTMTVNCEKMVIGSMLIKDIRSAMASS
ncbi:AP-3 complex subunit beta-2-like [Watersipora subatra]|uniref:AP-3 complex subunit beta-2-like n=1 Tax=Watersipora subatra TaxID=2589382 RepID=UPI00355B2F2C